MTKVVLNADLQAKLNGLNETMELCDASGTVVGHFLPPDVYRELIQAWANREFDKHPEELEQARAETGGMTTAEAIAYLEDVARRWRPKS